MCQLGWLVYQFAVRTLAELSGLMWSCSSLRFSLPKVGRSRIQLGRNWNGQEVGKQGNNSLLFDGAFQRSISLKHFCGHLGNPWSFTDFDWAFWRFTEFKGALPIFLELKGSLCSFTAALWSFVTELKGALRSFLMKRFRPSHRVYTVYPNIQGLYLFWNE